MLIGILGGTFDPIHLGHLYIADQTIHQLPLEKIFLVPCYKPVHRNQPIASPLDRTIMIQLAIRKCPKLYLDTREIDRQDSSFMIDTAISFRKDYPYNPLCLLIGSDAYLNFTTWKAWQELLNFIHIIVINRPNADLKTNIQLQKYQTDDKHQLLDCLAGKILTLEMTPCHISATQVRQFVKEKKAIDYLVPKEVAKYIRQKKLYV